MSAVLYVLAAATPIERRLLANWISDNSPTSRTHDQVELADEAALLARLSGALDRADDPDVRPLGVAWLPSQDHGKRSLRLRDVVEDPRHPRRWRQRRIIERAPKRVRVLDAESASLSNLVARWLSVSGNTEIDLEQLTSYVARQARLALGRAETKLVGPEHKVPHLVREEVFFQARFQSGIRRLADRTGRSAENVADEARSYLDEMVTTFNRFAIDVGTELSRLYHRTAYAGQIHTDPAQIDRVRDVARHYPVVFLPSHRSYIDSTILGVVMRDHGVPPNHRLGGVNMAVGPFGAIGRRTGTIFIRRNFRDNELYKWVLREYLGYLAEKRFSLEWYIEGTRSRTGKLGKPKMGLLAYVADAYLQARCEDYRLIPVSIVYDELIDVEEYSRYAKGGAKSAESVRWFVRYAARQRRRYGQGDIHVRFAEPVSLRELLGPPPPLVAAPGDDRVDLQKLAFEVAVRINQVTPITPTALAALILLAVEPALTLSQLRAGLDYALDAVRRRQLPLAAAELLETDAGVERSLSPLLRHDALTRFADGTEAVYAITPGQRTAASYFRNSIVHHFLDSAVAQVALIRATRPARFDPVGDVFDEALRLRDLLKFEFFFVPKDEFRDDVASAISFHDPHWEQHVTAGPEAALAMLSAWRPLVAPVVLRSFLDAYLVVAFALERSGGDCVRETTGLRAQCLADGRRLLLQRRIRGAESVSAPLFDSAIELADNYGLLEGDHDELVDRRRRFRDDIHRTIDALTVIERLAVDQFAERSVGLDGTSE